MKIISRLIFGTVLSATLVAQSSESGSEIDRDVVIKLMESQERYEKEKSVLAAKAAKHPGWQLIRNENGLEIPVYADIVGGGSKGPAVLVLHGSGGTAGHHSEWALRLNNWGYHTVLVESFKPRGAANIVETQSISPQQRVPDVIAAAQWVLKQPWSDGRIGMIGFSHGANTVFETSLIDQSPIKVGVAYYPYCHSWFSRALIPIQLHLAMEDDWTPANTCFFLYRGLSKPKKITAFEYDGAHHGFDLLRNLMIRQPAMSGGQLRMVTYGSNRHQGEISFRRVNQYLNEHLPLIRR